jgi:DNA end-binding protein Ku
VNPIFFHKPYYMEPQKGGDKAYVLLREALRTSGKIAIAKVVIKTRQHLAAVKPQEKGLVLELMHFATELIDVDEFKLPATKQIGKKELQMAEALIDSMSAKWNPEDYVDEYKDALEKVIEEKVEKGDKRPAKAIRKTKPTNVIDLVSVLQQSLKQSGGKGAKKAKSGSRSSKPSRRKAA